MVNGRTYDAYQGETIAAVLLAAGIRVLRFFPPGSQPHGIICGMGTCHECLVTVDGVHDVPACATEAADGMQVDIGWKAPSLSDRFKALAL